MPNKNKEKKETHHIQSFTLHVYLCEGTRDEACERQRPPSVVAWQGIHLGVMRRLLVFGKRARMMPDLLII